MADIKALFLLSAEVKNIRAIPSPPDDYSSGATYRQKTDTVVNKTLQTTRQVSNYATDINEGLEELKKALQETSKKVQNAIQRALDSIKVGDGTKSSNVLKYARELQRIEENKKRLEEFIVQTEIVVEKLKDNADCTIDDIDLLKGYLKSWQNEKNENYEEEKRRLEDEKRQREESERLRKEEKERKRKEEEERRSREEEERRKREEEEKLKREVEERLKQEEEERRKREEEERLKREEEDRIKREENDKRMQEEAEKRKRLEDEARRKEEERQKREAEKREKERLQREDDEKRRRLDPNNWSPVVYDRSCDSVDGDISYHKGLCCVLSAPIDSIEKTDVECNASDEYTDIIEILDDGEKIVSSVVDIESTKGELNLETSMRAYLPHCPVVDLGDELVMKVSINGSDWVTTTPIMPTSQTQTKESVKLLGVQLNNFDKAKVAVVARRKTQTIIVDKPGISQYSTYDKNIKLFVPRDAFSCPTELKLAIRPITDDTLSTLGRDNVSCEHVIKTSSMITLSCQKSPSNDIEIDLIKPPGQKTNKGKAYHLYRTNDNQWKFADAEYKGKHQDVSIKLPACKDKYTLIEIELQQNADKEDAIKAAESIYDHAHKSVVRLILKQKQSNTVLAMFHCVRREIVDQRLPEMASLGYTLGADTSREFCLKDGQNLHISCSGNIDTSSGTDGVIVLPFYTYMDSAKQEFTLYVKDTFKQRDLPEYIGNLKCIVDNSEGGKDDGLIIDMPLSIPKTERNRTNIKTARIRFPPHLTALTGFLSWKLTEARETDWFSVLTRLDDKRNIGVHHRHARSKCDENDERAICQSMLSDWMKTKPRQDDKVEPIQRALEDSGMHALSKQCLEFVEYHKSSLNDSVLREIGENYTGDVTQVGGELHLTTTKVKKCIKDHPGSKSAQMVSLLEEWRQSDDAIKLGTMALEHLKELLKV